LWNRCGYHMTESAGLSPVAAGALPHWAVFGVVECELLVAAAAKYVEGGFRGLA
jgi:hypothetical protein